ncbi:hypothetical protein Emed_003016 [Eimeria media]
MEKLTESGLSTTASSSDVEQGGPLRGTRSRLGGAPPSDASCCCLTRILRLSVHLLSAGWMAAVAAHALNHTFQKRGFFCNDLDIALPYKPQTVTVPLLFAISVVTPVVIVGCMEALLFCIRCVGDRGEKKAKKGIGRLVGRHVPESLVEVYRHLGAFFFAILSCWVLTEVLKNVVGSLRPHFLSVCKPNWEQLVCKRGGEYVYVSSYECRGEESSVVEARRSFPSGHSSFTFCGMLYTALYLQGRFKWQRAKTAPHQRHTTHAQDGAVGEGGWRAGWKRVALERLYWAIEAATPCLQILLLLVAFFVAATRVVDHYHHIRDVVAGGLVGALTALHAAFFVIDMRGRQY